MPDGVLKIKLQDLYRVLDDSNKEPDLESLNEMLMEQRRLLVHRHDALEQDLLHPKLNDPKEIDELIKVIKDKIIETSNPSQTACAIVDVRNTVQEIN